MPEVSDQGRGAASENVADAERIQTRLLAGQPRAHAHVAVAGLAVTAQWQEVSRA
jgi:hypothetical protein